MKTLEKDRNRRYTTANGLAMDIQRFLNDEPILARPVRVPERLWRWCRRNRVPASLSAALILFVLWVATLVVLVPIRRSELRTPPAPLPVPEQVAALPAGDVLKLAYMGAPPVRPLRW